MPFPTVTVCDVSASYDLFQSPWVNYTKTSKYYNEAKCEQLNRRPIRSDKLAFECARNETLAKSCLNGSTFNIAPLLSNIPGR